MDGIYNVTILCVAAGLEQVHWVAKSPLVKFESTGTKAELLSGVCCISFNEPSQEQKERC